MRTVTVEVTAVASMAARLLYRIVHEHGGAAGSKPAARGRRRGGPEATVGDGVSDEATARREKAEQAELVAQVLSAAGDPYAALGLRQSCSSKEVKAAFRRLARRLHPDKCASPTANERFKAVQEAYATLGDRSRRAAYDASL